MRANLRTILWYSTLSTALAFGLACDPAPSGEPSANVADTQATRALVTTAPLPKAVGLNVVARLPSSEVAAISVAPSGDIFFVQGAGDVMRLRGSAGASIEPTALTGERVLQALGADPAASGRFKTIAAREDGQLAFCFAGVDGARLVSAIGTFDPVEDRLFVTIDQIAISNAVDRTLPDATALDHDLSSDSARPVLFTQGDRAWLWRAGEKYIRLISIDQLSRLQPTITPSRISLEQVQDVVERSTWEWSATATAGEFFLTDTVSRWIRRIDGQGRMMHVARFDETVATISPAALDAAGRVVVLACDRDGVVQAMLVQNGDTFSAIGRDRFEGPDVSADQLLRFDRLYPVPNVPNTFIAYDATGGQLMRVELK